MIRILRALCLLAALALSAGDAAAQLEFAGIAWGTPAEQTADRLQAMGYVLRGVDQNGDHVFRGPGGEMLVARMSPDGVVQVQVEWSRDPARLTDQYARLADSLQAAFGRPFAEGHDDAASWTRGEAWVNLWLRPAAPQLDSTLFLFHTAPADAAEELRRGQLVSDAWDRERAQGFVDGAGPGDWAEADFTDRWAQFVDTSGVVVLGGGLYGARLRDRWIDHRRLENGLVYDAAVREVEVDCGQNRLRLLRTIPLYLQVTVAMVEVPADERRWDRPAAGSRAEASLRAVCAVLARQP
jgi:hypothetical protein